MSTNTATRTPAKKPVTTSQRLSTRTVLWWNAKVFLPGTGLTLFCMFAVPAIVHATGA